MKYVVLLYESLKVGYLFLMDYFVHYKGESTFEMGTILHFTPPLVSFCMKF